jgi:putative FmdB family regulatory protein
MPTYSYECRKCGHIQDVFHSITANPRLKCGECGGSCKRKLGVGAGIIFKGSGFYETDYKRNGAKASAEAKAESKSESKSESKGESKSETKSETKPKSESPKKSAAAETRSASG